MTRLAGANDVAGDTRIDSDPFAAPVVVAATISPIVQALQFISVSPSTRPSRLVLSARCAMAGPRCGAGLVRWKQAQIGKVRVHGRVGG